MIVFDRLLLKDFGPFAEAELPLAKQGLVLIVGDNRDTTSAASNGSGKSHLFKALCWVLWGDTVEGDKTDEVIRKGAKEAEVCVEFHDTTHVYRLMRSRGRAGGNLHLERDGGLISGAVMKETQAEVVKILGMDFQTFVNTVLYGQGDVHHFADPSTKDPDRKAVLKRILRLEMLDGALKYVKERRDAADKTAASHRARIPVLQAKLDGLDSAASEARAKELEARKVELKKKLARRPKLAEMRSKVEALLAEYEVKKKAIAALEETRRKADSNRAFHRISKVGHQQNVDRETKRLALFADGKCPTCGTPADGDHVAAEVDRIRAAISAAEWERDAAAQEESDAAHSAEEIQKTITFDKGDIADEMEWRGKLRTVDAELAALDRDAASVKALDADLAKEAATQEEAAKARAGIEAKILESEKAAAEEDEVSAHANFWVKGFGNQGLPSYIMDSAVPSLTEWSNKYLAILSDGDMAVSFDTEMKIKSGEVRDKFAVVATGVDINGRPSRGQQKKINIATDVGLMSLVAERERAGIDLLCLDEILDGLDAEGRSRIVDLLMELRKTRSSIFVVSHDPGLATVFEKVVTVVKEGGIARLA